MGYDVVVTHSGLADGLNVFAGMSEIEQASGIGDRTQWAIGATYAISSITLGGQWSRDDTAGAKDFAYDNQAYGVSFQVNDNLSLSYGLHKSEKGTASGTATTELEGQSLQVSYTVGGASIKFAESEVDNQNYVANTNREGRTIALTLAF